MNSNKQGFIRIIDEQIGGKGQRTYFRRAFELHGARFLIDIEVDSYPNQSHSRISHWHDGRWEHVYGLHPSEMLVDFKMGHKAARITEDHFEAVVSRLIHVVEEVVLQLPEATSAKAE